MNKMVMFVISETVFSFYEPFAISPECLLRATVTNKKVNIRLFCAPHSEGTSGESNIWPIFLQFIFGKTRLNENSVEPFFHFNAFWKRSNALQIIFNAF